MNELAIERNHQALKRLLAILFVYIGLADDTGDAMGANDRLARALRALSDPMTISRRLHRMIHELLRPVEAATRRLIVALAGRLPAPKFSPSEIAPEQTSRRASGPGPSPDTPRSDAEPATCPPRFALIDPLKRFHSCHADFPAGGFAADPTKAEDQLPDAHLMRRIAALASALDDLPRQARRFARWRALRDAQSKDHHKPPRRSWPLKPGLAPGAPPRNLPKSRWREEHHILAETHSLAWQALHRPDTS